MMTLACAAIGPNGERCARAAGHPGQHVPVAGATASPVQPSGLVAATGGSGAAMVLPGTVGTVTPATTPKAAKAAKPARAAKAAKASDETASVVEGKAATGEDHEAGAWTVPPEPIVRTDQAILGILLLALLYGVGAGVATLAARWTSAADARAEAAHAAGATVTGRGDQTTTTFQLDGDYLVRWAASPVTANGCYHAAVLERADNGQQVELLVNEAIAAGATQRGTLELPGLARNEYRVYASSDCAWSFSFEGR
jgi:hypothetical protein